MSNNKRPLTDADRARIAADAETLLAFFHTHGRPGNEPGELTVVRPRGELARQLGWPVRRLTRAEQVLTARRAIKSDPLLPRNPEEAEARYYRWITR